VYRLCIASFDLKLSNQAICDVSESHSRGTRPTIWLYRCLVRNYDGLRILLRDQQDFPRGTLFRCCVRLVRVFQCETLAKRDRQPP